MKKNGTNKVLLLASYSMKNENCLMEAIDKSENIDFNCALLDHSLVFRTLRRICFKFNLGIGIWLGN